MTGNHRCHTIPPVNIPPIPNLLNLPDWTILRTEETEEGAQAYQIMASYAVPATMCSSCLRFGFLQRFGKRQQLYLDLPMHGKRVGIQVERQRYRCTHCGHTMLQPLPDMDEKRQMTQRLLRHIGEASLRRTFVSIAEECGLDEKTVRNVFHEHVTQLDATTTFATPAWLGIDELTLMRHPRCIMTNLQERTIVALLRNRNQTTVARHLSELHQRDRVELVAMDMWTPYRDAVRAVLPQAQIIVDKFHVVRMANQALESIRKELRKSLTDRQRRALMHDRFVLLRRRHDLTEKDLIVLEVWMQHAPLLVRAYALKEQFYDIWKATRRIEAERAYAEWIAALPTELETAFRPLLTAFANWHEEIFAYFAVPGARITNATTEALNGVAKLAQRSGRGYSFEAIRAKLLYGVGKHRQIRETYRQAAAHTRLLHHSIGRPRKWGRSLHDSPRRYPTQRLMLNLGADISTVSRTLENEAKTVRSTG